MLSVTPIPAFKDNYIWLILNTANNKALVVDPGDAAPVLAYCENQQIQPIAILITHYHSDHTGGIAELVNKFNVDVYGPSSSKIPLCNKPCVNNDTLYFDDLNSLDLQVISVPGHTLDHIAFYGNNWLFCGDTLFAGGCGRVFEGTFKQMFESLNKLKNLPASTEVYCAHEYTLKNLEFAISIDPNNQQLKKRISEVRQLRNNNQTTLPSTIGTEKQTNPFFLTDSPDLNTWASKRLSSKNLTKLDVFQCIREHKNKY